MITIRKAGLEDFEFFYAIKSEDNNIFWTGHDKKPDRTNLHRFFSNAVENSRGGRTIYIIEKKQIEKVGYIYIIPDSGDTNTFELSISISTNYQGKGFAKEAVRLGLIEGRKQGFQKMRSSIREDNIASLKTYVACGANISEDYRLVYIPKLDSMVKMFFVEVDLE